MANTTQSAARAALADDQGPAGLALMAGIGAAAGLALYFLTDGMDEAVAPQRLAAIVGVFALAGYAILLWPGARKGRRLGAAAGIALLAALLTQWRVHIAGPDADDWGFAIAVWMGAGFPLLSFLDLVLAAVALDQGRLRWPFPAVFQAALALPIAAGMGVATGGAVTAFILLWAAAFDMMGAGALAEGLRQLWLILPVAGGAAALGAAFVQRTQGLRAAGEAVLLIGARIVLPLLAVFSALFAALLPFTGMEELGRTLSPTGILLALALAAMVVFNGVYGEGAKAPPRPLRWAAWLALAVLPIYAALALYGIGARIADHGLTPERMVVFVVTLLTALYTLLLLAGLASEAPRWRAAGRWMAPVARLNVAAAMAWVAALVLMQTPVLDPVQWSVRSQLARLESGATPAAEFDYAWLQYRAGRPGRAAADRLANRTDHPEVETIQAEIQRAREAGSYYRADFERRDAEREAVALPAAVEQELTAMDADIEALAGELEPRLDALGPRIADLRCGEAIAALDEDTRREALSRIAQRQTLIYRMVSALRDHDGIGGSYGQAALDAMYAECPAPD